MKLRDLFTNGERFDHPDHEVTHALPLDATGVGSDSLRFDDGRDIAISSLFGGVVVRGPGFVTTGIQVFSEDPKASFFEAVRRLYPDGHPPVLTIQPGLRTGQHVVIGGEGFGFYKGQRVPHIGGVTIGQDVEIGSGTCIDRGTLGDTIIGDRTKIDNLVHLAHNCVIGKDCMIVAHATICGSVIIEDGVWVGAGATILQKLRIGKGAVIGAGAVVTKDVPAGATVVGNPARILSK